MTVLKEIKVNTLRKIKTTLKGYSHFSFFPNQVPILTSKILNKV